jgi:hypothetical protein
MAACPVHRFERDGKVEAARRGQNTTVAISWLQAQRAPLIPLGWKITVATSATRSTMMTGRAVLLSTAFAALLAVLPVKVATAANWLELNFYLSGPRYEGVLPPCDHQRALHEIANRFNQRENVFWQRNLAILAFEKIRETAFRPWAANTIPRRFCSGIVHVTDGSTHTIHYSIGEDTEMVGHTWGVEWCVVGLDRNWAYSPACKMARP